MSSQNLPSAVLRPVPSSSFPNHPSLLKLHSSSRRKVATARASKLHPGAQLCANPSPLSLPHSRADINNNSCRRPLFFSPSKNSSPLSCTGTRRDFPPDVRRFFERIFVAPAVVHSPATKSPLRLFRVLLRERRMGCTQRKRRGRKSRKFVFPFLSLSACLPFEFFKWI